MNVEPEPLKAEPPRVVSMKEAARLLSVGLTTLKGLVKSGHIETVRIGGRRMVPRSEIERVATPRAPKKSIRRQRALSQIQDPDALLND